MSLVHHLTLTAIYRRYLDAIQLMTYVHSTLHASSSEKKIFYTDKIFIGPPLQHFLTAVAHAVCHYSAADIMLLHRICHSICYMHKEYCYIDS